MPASSEHTEDGRMDQYQEMTTAEIDANKTFRAMVFNAVLESGWPEKDNSWPEEQIDGIHAAELAALKARA